MEDDQLRCFLMNAGHDEYLALRNKIASLNNVTFDEFVQSIDKIIDLYQQ